MSANSRSRYALRQDIQSTSVSFAISLNLSNTPGRAMPWGLLSFQQKYVPDITKIIMFLGSKVRPVRRADKLVTICEATV
jgi:hypothetical protein